MVSHKYINYPSHVYRSFYNQSHTVVYQSITRTEIECGTQCAADPYCVGFQFDSQNMKCQYDSGCITLVNSTFEDMGKKAYAKSFKTDLALSKLFLDLEMFGILRRESLKFGDRYSFLQCALVTISKWSSNTKQVEIAS